MTQSGQGEQPSAGPAREGVVLPSDGGGPLLPGQSGPPGGQGWDGAWAPEQQAPAPGHPQAPAPGGPAQGWPAAPAQPWGQSGPGPLPPEGAQPPAYGAQAPHPASGPAYGYGPAEPSYGAPGRPQGPAGPSYGPAGQAYGAPAQSYGAPGQSYGPPPGQAHGTAGPAYGQPAAAYDGSGGAASAPLPPAHEGATQYLPPVPGGQGGPGADAATQYLPPVPPSADDGATQYIPPVSAGALPPERPAGAPSEETRFLGRVPHASPPGAPAGPDAEATQYIPPVPGQPAAAPYGAAPGGDAGRQPPAEFDNLFRAAPGGDGPAASTQQMPLVGDQPPYGAAPGAPAQQGPGGYVPQGPGGYPPQGPGAYDGGGSGRGGRSGSRVPLLAAIGVGLAVVGVGAGALLAGGGDGEEKDPGRQTVSATAPATPETSASPTVDPVRQQAEELDKLLADSGSSRAAVIKAVAEVRGCDNLPEAARSLREAAKQRTALVTRLRQLAVDRLPDHAALTDELTKAWQASASADNHYAAWADQVAGKNGCKKGQARSTGHTQAGNRASTTANTHKREAARLWNAIAQRYQLTSRQASQL
ncbi:hypothetical protein TU94_14485 [Streptomyces cyaneogriseus subsp. noncyanogenus]|uniref:Uncharacterized protein n=1 Tax=Streptomyces cyaneogriseus subsp. noncyanogenus TaxID=477245 RepID=A0A0C5FY15_9ACTN|nr:hypothetical protein [Streptomyces cyaneogriseus]AJP02513.1 hypothetical protein TU94_14485 [Streptomyces cyaneogriseus subsp. noncyanogenus]